MQDFWQVASSANLLYRIYCKWPAM